MHAIGAPINNKFKVSHKKYLLPMELLLCTTSISWLLFIVLLLISLLTPVFLQREKDKRLIKHPPSPPMLSTIKTIFRIHLFGLPQLFLWRLSKKYGSMLLLRLGCLPTLIVSSAEIATEIMKTQDFNFCSRPPLVSTRRFSNNFIDVAVAPYSEYWREMRKIYVLKVMSMKSVHSYRCVREEEVSIVINSIRSSKNSSSSRTPMVNLDEKLFSLTINIFFRVLFGKSRQARMTIGGYTFEEVVRDVTQTIGCLSAADLIPYIGWVIDVITGKHASLEKDYHGFYSFMEHFISEYMDPKMAKSKINKAMIDTLFELEGKELRGTIVTREHIKAVLGDIFGGGIDTSYVTMVWAMAELVKNPRIMKKVQDEVRSCVAKKGKVDESDLDQLQYLKMVIKETLRLHPPAPLLMPRECMKQTKVNGYDICPKTMVLVNVWALGRDPKSWVNPEVFYPERFMDNSIDFRGQHFELLPFGAGRRGCPGISMGNAIMELTLANLLYSFNWELPTGMKIEDLDTEEAGTFMLHKKSGLQLVPIAYDMQSIKESC